MGDEPIWLTSEDVEAIHDDQLARYGGRQGTNNFNLVESAVAAPRHLMLYEHEDDVLVLGIRMCRSIAKNHAYIDGNKRTAAAALIEFLARNGFDLFVPDQDPEEPLLGRWIERLTEGSLSEAELYDLLEHFVQEA